MKEGPQGTISHSDYLTMKFLSTHQMCESLACINNADRLIHRGSMMILDQPRLYGYPYYP
jgi:hypothetical protein